MSAPEIGLYPEATPDEKIAYEMGWRTAQAIDRAAAFGAIRRAVEAARRFDAERDRLLRERPMTDFRRFARLNDVRAEAIRIAIRAAIGSDKT